MLIEVDDEVLFGLEFPGKLGCMHLAQSALLRVCDLVRFHWLNVEILTVNGWKH